jgi:hypothetical protein
MHVILKVLKWAFSICLAIWYISIMLKQDKISMKFKVTELFGQLTILKPDAMLKFHHVAGSPD